LESESADLLPSSGPVACVRNFTEAFVQTCKETSPNRRLDQAGQEGPAGVILNNKFYRDGKKKKKTMSSAQTWRPHTRIVALYCTATRARMAIDYVRFTVTQWRNARTTI